MTEPCLHHRYAALHGTRVGPCRAPRIFDTPYCLEHLHRVAWLSFGVRVVYRVQWWAIVGLLLAGAMLGAEIAG